MKRLAFKIVGLSTAFLLMAGCGGGGVDIDPASAVTEMNEKITFTDQFASVDEQSINRIYGIDESLVETCAAMSGSGATAEGLAMWKAKDESSAEKIVQQLTDFLKEYKEGYADYKPEEVPKLDNAILKRDGVYVVLCISADNEAAKTVVDDILKG